jgi:glycolate oxidase FAD binding subunit
MSAPTASTLERGLAHVTSVVGQEHTEFVDETLIAAPEDAEQISAILRFANEFGLSVSAKGSGTKQSWGNPVEPSVMIDLRRMQAVREHSWQDMTCGVEAGCSWAAMQADLARHGQMVALDPLWPERATVGGIVATNDSGALRLKFGGLRDLIIGMMVVLADGTIARTGGKVVKNVAGYDLHKLMIGSFGTLGVIASVNFRLHPIEQHSRTWTACADDAAMLDAPLRALLDSQMTPSSIQVRAGAEKSALDIRIAGRADSLDNYATRVQEIFTPLAVSESEDAVWSARQDLFDASRAFVSGDTAVLKASVLSSEICAISAELQRWAAEEGIEFASVAQANGLMTVEVKSSPDSLIELIGRLRVRVRRSGGSVVALEIPGVLHGRLDVWDCSADSLPLMREIKRRFDPNRILNPGRFVGNI